MSEVRRALVRVAGVQPRPRAADCGAQPFEVERLGQIVGCIQFKRPYGMLCEGRHEDDFGSRTIGPQPHHHVQAIQPGHLNVQDGDVRLQFANKLQRLLARAGGGDQLDLGNAGQGLSQARQGQAKARVSVRRRRMIHIPRVSTIPVPRLAGRARTTPSI